MIVPLLDGSGSLQEQARRTIFGEISGGTYPPGAQLPTEKEYAERLGVSLITVRNALASLVQAGYIERASGRGTFVSGREPLYRMALTSCPTDSLRAAGVPFRIDVAVAAPGVPPDDVRRALKLAKGTSAFRLERVAVLHDRPAILLDSWLKRSAARAFERDPELPGDHSLHALLAARGIRPARTEGRLELVYATDRDAGLLRLQFGAPLLAYESTTSDERGRPIEHTRAMYDANRFSLTIPSS